MRHLFFDDYSEGVHPELLQAIAADNAGQQEGYGLDEVTQRATQRIRARFNVDADVHFVAGCTLANLTAISSMLRSHQGIIAPTTGHIAVHETGAIEATGHKIITVAAPNGKLTPQLIDQALDTHKDEHSVMPKAVFVTQATEAGTAYTKGEFASVVRYAKERDLYVYVDGARLAMALGAEICGMEMADIGSTGVDVFTIGGTKAGGMFGDAIVICREELRTDFRYQLKQRGALLAKGRFAASQFSRFFDTDDLWLQLGKQANNNARKLAQGVAALGISLAYPCEINQVFMTLPNDIAVKLAENWGFHEWERPDPHHVVIRLVCSWATPPQVIDELITDLAELHRL